MELVRHVSFVDCPGHDILMATMLNGAAVMDGAMLLIAANEPCPQPQTSEHLAAVEIMRLQHIIILQARGAGGSGHAWWRSGGGSSGRSAGKSCAGSSGSSDGADAASSLPLPPLPSSHLPQNKVDLVTEAAALNQHETIQRFIQGTIAEGAPVVPISAQVWGSGRGEAGLERSFVDGAAWAGQRGRPLAVACCCQALRRCAVQALLRPCPTRACACAMHSHNRAPVPRPLRRRPQLKYNVDAVCEYLVKKIPVPVRDFTSPPQARPAACWGGWRGGAGLAAAARGRPSRSPPSLTPCCLAPPRRAPPADDRDPLL